VTATSTKWSGGNRWVLAASIEEYLNQEPQLLLQSDGIIDATSGDVVECKYIPRTEWCSHTMLEYMIKTELNKVQHRFQTVDLSDMLKHFRGDYSTPGNTSIMSEYDPPRKRLRGESDKHKQTLTKEEVDFVAEQMISNVIYFDINSYIWKTNKIHNTSQTYFETTPSTETNSDITSSSSTSQMHHLQCTFETFLTRRHQYSKQMSERKMDTILHTAIRKNATSMAMEIIRIEYHTYLECVSSKR
jgi:hypothetical protein